MKLMTKELEKKLPALYDTDQDVIGTPTVYAKYFHPMSHWTWYATEYDPDTEIFYGYVKGDFPELGYFSLEELENTKVFGLGIERDLYWIEKPLSEVMSDGM